MPLYVTFLLFAPCEPAEDCGAKIKALGVWVVFSDSCREGKELEEEQRDPGYQQLVLATEIGFCDHGTFFED